MKIPARVRRGGVGAVLAGAILTAAATPAPGLAQLAGSLVDPGLHREWRIEVDRAHPERPPRLVEVSCSGTKAAAERRNAERGPRSPERTPAPVVRAGMKVTLRWKDAATDLRLTGTALDQGWMGDRIRVRAGLHNAVLRAVVRGPGIVELERGRP